MRSFKIAAYVAGALLALVAVALVLIAVLVDPNHYKADIARMVQSKTGRRLTLNGDLKLSVFPWLAIETGPVALADAPGFGDEPFVSLQHARIAARLWPLLLGRVEVGEVRLDAPRIHLITDEQGRNNWSDLGGASKESAAAGKPGATFPTIAGLQLRDGSVVLENRKDKSRLTLDKLNLKTGRLAAGNPFDVTLDGTVTRDQQTFVDVALKTEATVDLERNSYSLSKPQIDLTLKGAAYPPRGLQIKVRSSSLDLNVAQKRYLLTKPSIEADWRGKDSGAKGLPITLTLESLQADLAAQTLQVKGLLVKAGDAQLHGSLTGKEILDAPELNGRIVLNPVVPRTWLSELGITLPPTRDGTVFKRLEFDATVAVTQSSAALQNLTMKLDDTTAHGSLAVVDFAAKALRFDLDVDQINADRYLPAKPAGAPASGESKPTQLPLDLLRSLNLRGELKIAQATFSGMKFSKLRVGLTARDGMLRVNPSEASLYGGQYRGDIGLDATGAKARLTMDEHISGVDFAPLLKDLVQTQRVSGKGAANLKISATGNDTAELLQSLDGPMDFNVSDGAWEGMDLWYEIRRARALLRQQTIPVRSGPQRTAFQSMRGTGMLQKGVWNNNDLGIGLQYLKVTGAGTANLVKSELDYRLVATVLKIPDENSQTAGMTELVDAQIPVLVSGPFAAPKVRPDIEGLLKNQAKQRLDVEKKKLEDKVRNKLQDKLKGILGGG